MVNFAVENTKFINVEGTDALLQVLRVKKRKTNTTLTKVIPISKSSLLDTPLHKTWQNGAIMSASVSLWVMMSGVLALPFIPILFALGVPLFTTIFEHINDWLTQPVDHTLGGREEDKKVYQAPETMPVFDFSEELFNRSNSSIIDAYNEQYEKFVKNNPELELPDNTTGQEQNQEEMSNEYVRDRSFTKVFYGDDDSNELTGDKLESEPGQTEENKNTQAMQELLEELNNMPTNETENITITDKRTFKNSGYYTQQ